jgi:hypothetical protein
LLNEMFEILMTLAMDIVVSAWTILNVDPSKRHSSPMIRKNSDVAMAQ